MAAITTRITSGTGATVKNLPLSSVEIDTNFINLNADIALRATLATPAFTGTPTAPTAASGTNNTQLATTEFVATGFLPIANPTATGTLTAPTIVGTATTNSTSTTTGALKTTGGLGVSRDFYLGGNMYAVGDITSAYTSDERLKTEIVPLTSALSIVQALEGKAFVKDGKASVGLIAQQVQKVLPQVVVTGEDEIKTLSVQYGNIVAVLIEAIKEQQVQIEELKAKVGI